MSHKPILEVKKVSKAYNGRHVIDDLNLTLEIGEKIAVFAPSGAGKTTLVKMLAGLELPDAGTIEFAHQRPAIQFQEPRLFSFLNVMENILVPFEAVRKKPTRHELIQLQTWLQVTGLDEFTKHYPYQLSGGMKQKAALIRAVMANPTFLLLDEPFQSIEIESKQEILAHFRRNYSDSTVLLITHSPREVLLLANRALVFRSPHLFGKDSLMIDDVNNYFERLQINSVSVSRSYDQVNLA